MTLDYLKFLRLKVEKTLDGSSTLYNQVMIKSSHLVSTLKLLIESIFEEETTKVK